MSLTRKMANKLAGIEDKAQDVTGDFEKVFGGTPLDGSKTVKRNDLGRRAAESIEKSEENFGPEDGFFDFDRDNDGRNDLQELKEDVKDSDEGLDRRFF